MEYIHERADWPKFRWRQENIADQLAAVRHKQGRLLGRMESLGFSLREEAMLRTLTEDVLKSSEIEGEILDKDQVRSSIARRLGMDIGALAPADRNVEGVVEMMLDAIQRYREPLTAERLFGWHASLFPTGYSGVSKIVAGAWRDGNAGPMQVVSGPIGREKVHFEAPASERLDPEMHAFLDWFGGDAAVDPVVKAALAHLWFVTIHPFEDGNGRIARAIADMALARSEGSSQRFYSLSAQIRHERKDYYDRLEATQKGDLDVTAWLEWFLGCLERAVDGADAMLASILYKAKFWQRRQGEAFNRRQRLMLNKLFDGLEGKLTSSKWAIIAKCSQDTASRDIDDLLRRHILAKDPSGGRSTSYTLIASVADALYAAAHYAAAFADKTVWDSGSSPTPEQKEVRRQQIMRLAFKINALAETSTLQRIAYADFDVIRKQIEDEGVTLDGNLVFAVAAEMQSD